MASTAIFRPGENDLISAVPFAAFDLETTGMDPVVDRIIEIGVTIFRGGEVIGTFNTLVNPGMPMPKEAYDIHQIGDEELRDQPSIEMVLPKLLEHIAGAIPVAHNAPFDVSFVMEAARRMGLPFPADFVVDSCLMAKKLFPDLPNHRLSFLVEKFGLPVQKAHRALGDSSSCFSLFCRGVDELPLKWETPWNTFLSTVPGVFSINSPATPMPEKLAPFRDAFSNHERIVLSYQDGKGEVTLREVTPMGITSEGKKIVLIGYCHLRRGTRSFRVDRILKVNRISLTNT